MKEIGIKIRNSIEKAIYKTIVKKIFFLQDPEKVHDRMIKFGHHLGKYKLTRVLTSLCFNYQNKILKQDILGMHFKNPVGLAAGFDKNAYLTDILPAVGFGFIDIGSITGEPCAGNPKPRIWRLPKSKALVVNYGLANEGCEAVKRRLYKKVFQVPIDVSVAKTNCKETATLEGGIKDYVKAYQELLSIGDFITVNLSCPNAYGGQPFNEKARLDKLLTALEKVKTTKPVFLKLSPELKEKEIDEIITVAKQHKIQGFIIANLSKKREDKKILDKGVPMVGGLSGKLAEEKADKMIDYVYKKTKGKFVIIGCGGIFSAEDAYKKIKLGASLVQLITGMIFEGPQLISEINQGLVKLLRKEGYKNISEAIGTAYKD